jgi:hypothetical protein
MGGDEMENDVMVYDDNVPAIADDNLLRVAEMAERRIDAVIKIKQMALKVTNAGDWVDQSGKPYLFVSGSEKVANLFNISWRIDEPVVDTEADGHFTYTLRGVFSIPGRSISAEGSRSSKDPFFKQYDWNNGVKTEKPISAIDRRDVRMAALTNLLGNGITRLLGIRNLSYDDLEKYAGITKEMIGMVDYKKGKEKEPIKEPQKKSEPAETTMQMTTAIIASLAAKEGEKNGKKYKRFLVTDTNGTEYATFDSKIAENAKVAHGEKISVNISFTTGKFGNDIQELTLNVPEEAA